MRMFHEMGYDAAKWWRSARQSFLEQEKEHKYEFIKDVGVVVEI